MGTTSTITAAPTETFRRNRERRLAFFQRLGPETDPTTLRLADLFHRVGHALNQLGESSLAEAGLSYSQYWLLMQLLYQEQFEGRAALNPSEISRWQGLSRNAVSSLVRNLEDEGFINRELDINDRRRFLIRITAAGRELVHEHASRHFNVVQACFEELTLEDQETMSEFLERMAENPLLRAAHRGGGYK